MFSLLTCNDVLNSVQQILIVPILKAVPCCPLHCEEKTKGQFFMPMPMPV